MIPQISIALQITVVGMSLVFGAILLLWAVMALLVRLAGPDKEAIPAEQAGLLERERKTQAAAVAVAFALAEKERRLAEGEPHEFPLPPTAVVSAWQTVMRTNMLNKRGHIR